MNIVVTPAPQIEIASTSLPDAVVNANYTATREFAVVVGVGPYTWTLVNGALPSGLLSIRRAA